jgi:hypothetical protein
VTFHIGQQNAGVVNNVAGDQHIAAGQHGSSTSSLSTAGEAWQALRDALADLPENLTIDRDQVADCVHRLDRDLNQPQPDRRRVARTLDRLTGLLRSAGALTVAAGALAPPLRLLAEWLAAR